MAYNPSPFGPKPQFVNAAGSPDLSYQLFFYIAGSNTKQNTYSNSTGASANPNPIPLNSLGQPANEIWFTEGLNYKAVLAPPTDTDPPTSPIWTIDNLKGMGSVSSTTTQDQWVLYAQAPTYISATSFSVTGNQTATFLVGRRVKTTNTAGTVYSTIATSVFGAVTTLTLTNDSGSLDAGLSAVSYGLLSPTNVSIPTPLLAGRLIGIQTITATGTYTPTTGTNSVVVELIGGGGGGGGAPATGATSVSAGSGGSAGGYGKGRYTSSFSGVAVTIGAGGAGVVGASGSVGGTTSFGALLSANGGPGGIFSGPAVPPFGSTGSTVCSVGSGGFINTPGAAGGVAIAPAAGSQIAGPGASSQFGAGGNLNGINSTGGLASGYGGGGAGSFNGNTAAALAGGAGAPGVVIVYEYA